MKARQIARYYFIYKEYLLQNNLEDDSNSIKVKDLVQFVENEIDQDELHELTMQVTF